MTIELWTYFGRQTINKAFIQKHPLRPDKFKFSLSFLITAAWDDNTAPFIEKIDIFKTIREYPQPLSIELCIYSAVDVPKQ